MKRIEDIEILQDDELEAAALGEDIKVPAGLEGRIKSAIAAKESLKPKAVPARWIPYAAFAVAAGLGAVVVVQHNGSGRLRDTFDDPLLAYAQVEATFQKISDKMALGVDLAAKAGETAEKPVEIINKIK